MSTDSNDSSKEYEVMIVPMDLSNDTQDTEPEPESEELLEFKDLNSSFDASLEEALGKLDLYRTRNFDMFLFQDMSELELVDVFNVYTRKNGESKDKLTRKEKIWIEKVINKQVDKLLEDLPKNFKDSLLKVFSKKDLFMIKYTHDELEVDFDIPRYVINKLSSKTKSLKKYSWVGYMQSDITELEDYLIHI